MSPTAPSPAARVDRFSFFLLRLPDAAMFFLWTARTPAAAQRAPFAADEVLVGARKQGARRAGHQRLVELLLGGVEVVGQLLLSRRPCC